MPAARVFAWAGAHRSAHCVRAGSSHCVRARRTRPAGDLLSFAGSNESRQSKEPEYDLIRTTCQRVRPLQVGKTSDQRLDLVWLWKLNPLRVRVRRVRSCLFGSHSHCSVEGVPGSPNNRLGSLATSARQIVFRPSSLVPFFWANRRKYLAGRAKPAGSHAVRKTLRPLVC